MNLEELLAAIERVNRINHGGSSLAAEYEKYDDRCYAMSRDEELIADAFTNLADIDYELLEALGPSTRGHGWRYFSFGRMILRQHDDGTWLAYIGTINHPADPQPQTMGDVCFLVWRLTRTHTGG